MKSYSQLRMRLFFALGLALVAPSASANAFIPTMISANVLWLFVLPLVVAIEGWLMNKWNWLQPYKNSLIGNLLSMLAALPLGFLLSMLGYYFASGGAKTDIPALSDATRFFLAQVFLYGNTPAPTYGFAGYTGAGYFLAALLFMGVCWLATIFVEGNFYVRKNPSQHKREVYVRTGLANLASYAVLTALWLPFSYISASSGEDVARKVCASADTYSSHCPALMLKFPELKEQRLVSCRNRRGVSEDLCLKGQH